MYDYAQDQRIDIDWVPIRHKLSISIPIYDTYAIAMNPWHIHSTSEEYCILAHELGHCMRHAFYNVDSPFDLMNRHENKADKWAIMHTLSADDLDQALAQGCDNICSLADHFGVTEPFMKKAVCWYTHGNLAVESYCC